jgi:hypothetical protein
MPPPPPSDNSTGVAVAMVFAGIGVYSAVNTVLGFFIFFAALSQGNTSGGSANSVALVGVGAAILVIVGLVAGIGLLFVRKPWATGMGLGLMIGWALWSITTAGFCTGINPGLYG